MLRSEVSYLFIIILDDGSSLGDVVRMTL